MTSFLFCVLICLYMNVRIRAAVSRASNNDIAYVDENGTPKTESATSIAGLSSLESGWYYAEGSRVITKLEIEDDQDVKIILTDGCVLNISEGISGGDNTALTIYGQSAGTQAGKLIAEAHSQYFAGINIATIIINGGDVKARGGDYGSGIGGGYHESGGQVTINGGVITAAGRPGGAGIGGGNGGDGGLVVINGGVVIATGGNGASGIGGGMEGSGGNVYINGGVVIAQGGSSGSGIGGGYKGGGGQVVIRGGSVKALQGFSGGADIGAGETRTDHGTLKNSAGSNVWLNTITINGPVVANAPVSETVIDCVSSYGTRDVVTNYEGKVYYYLPSSEGEERIVEMTVGGNEYKGKYTRAASHDNVKNLTPDESKALEASACPKPDADAAVRLKRPLALAVIVAVIAWLV